MWSSLEHLPSNYVFDFFFMPVWQVVEFIFDNFNVVLFALDVDVLHKEKGHNIRKVLSRFPLFMALTSKLLLFHNLLVRVYFVSNLNLSLLYITSSAWVLKAYEVYFSWAIHEVQYIINFWLKSKTREKTKTRFYIQMLIFNSVQC